MTLLCPEEERAMLVGVGTRDNYWFGSDTIVAVTKKK